MQTLMLLKPLYLDFLDCREPKIPSPSQKSPKPKCHGCQERNTCSLVMLSRISFSMGCHYCQHDSNDQIHFATDQLIAENIKRWPYWAIYHLLKPNSPLRITQNGINGSIAYLARQNVSLILFYFLAMHELTSLLPWILKTNHSPRI